MVNVGWFLPCRLGKDKESWCKNLEIILPWRVREESPSEGEIKGYQTEAQGLEIFYNTMHWGRGWPMRTQARSFVCGRGRVLAVMENAGSPSNLPSSPFIGLELQQGSPLLSQTTFSRPLRVSPVECDRKSWVWFWWYQICFLYTFFFLLVGTWIW